MFWRPPVDADPLPIRPRRRVYRTRPADSTISPDLAKPRNRTLDLAAYLALRVVHMVMHCWPVELNLYVARQLGNVMYLVDARHRRRAMGNITRSFPEMPEARRRQLARRSMQSLFMLGVETMFTPRLIHVDTFARYIDLGDARQVRQTLDLLLNSHRGLLMLTGHYGNWEVLGYALATLGFETTSVARPLDNPHISNFVFGIREKRGQKIIAKKGATDEIVSTIESGGMVGLVADQNAGPKGIFVDFFGRKASTYKSIALLAMQYEIPVVVGYTRRTDGRFRFEMKLQDIIRPADWKDQADPLRYITQRYTRAIEDFVRGDPGQYLWVHRRWKTRPKGESPEAFD
jgi:Kdo2-lipid IVA lauroyltransferase/acyltransferase